MICDLGTFVKLFFWKSLWIKVFAKCINVCILYCKCIQGIGAGNIQVIFSCNIDCSKSDTKSKQAESNDGAEWVSWQHRATAGLVQVKKHEPLNTARLSCTMGQGQPELNIFENE